jgi:hypothetical protein
MQKRFIPLIALLVLFRPGAPAAWRRRRSRHAWTSTSRRSSSSLLKSERGCRRALPWTRNIDADPSKEVALFGAIWIGAPVAKYVAALQDIENFEKGAGFRATKKISEPARVEDFAALTLPDDDVTDLKGCKVGDCELKLSEAALLRLRKEVDWSKPDAKTQLERHIRVVAAEYVNAYRQGGNAELAVYRDSENPTFVANEFREMVNGMPELSQYLTDMRQYLLEYPKPRRRRRLVHLLAGGVVRAQADHPYQPRRHPGREGRHDRRVQAALFEPLLLDRAGAARAGARSEAWHRFLVRERQPQPLGRPERLRRPHDPRQGADSAGRAWSPGSPPRRRSSKPPDRIRRDGYFTALSGGTGHAPEIASGAGW